jgi:hypothetical protein
MTTRRRRTTAPRLLAGLAACLVLAAAGPVSAQGLEAGVRGGVNLSTTASEGDPRGLGWRTGPVGGGFLIWPLAGGLALQPEALYTSKGAKYDEAGIDARLVLDYFEIPVLVRVPMPAVGGAYVAAGPALALRLRARTRTDFGGAIEELDIAADVERTDVGIVVAGGFAVGRIVIDGRYTHGLADVDRDEAVAVRNRTVSVTAGIRF